MGFRQLAILLLLGALLSPAVAESIDQTKPSQYWGRIFWPDSSRHEKSLMFDLMQELTTRLPEYQHQYQAMSLSRGFIDLKRRNDLCVVGLIRSAERDKVGYYVGLWPVLPPQLVIRRTDRQAIAGLSHSVSLTELLQRSDLRSAMIQERNYGPELEPLIQSAIARGQVQSLHTSNHSNNLLTMLSKGRFDFTVDYLESFQSSTETQTALRKSLLLLPLTEAQTPNIAGIYCPRTPQGKALIERIDQIARQPKVLARFKTLMEDSLPTEQRKHYEQWINDYFAKRSQYSLTNTPE